MADGGGAGGLGGGGAGSSGSTRAVDALANSGGGGGAAGYSVPSSGQLGGNGGAGIVIIRYLVRLENGVGATNTTSTSSCLTGRIVSTAEAETTLSVYWAGLMRQ